MSKSPDEPETEDDSNASLATGMAIGIALGVGIGVAMGAGIGATGLFKGFR